VALEAASVEEMLVAVEAKLLGPIGLARVS
jgi:hypothetical protein